jgi:hypothetical protein
MFFQLQVHIRNSWKLRIKKLKERKGRKERRNEGGNPFLREMSETLIHCSEEGLFSKLPRLRTTVPGEEVEALGPEFLTWILSHMCCAPLASHCLSLLSSQEMVPYAEDNRISMKSVIRETSF